MPIENEEIGSDSKNKKIIENFRKQLNIQIARAKVEKTHCKWLIKTINNDDITLFFSSLIRVDSLLWFLNSIHNVYHELLSLYNNKFLVFDEKLLANLKDSYLWINQECVVFNEEHNLIIKFKDMFKENFPDEYFAIIKFKKNQAWINFEHYFSELKLPENIIKFWKQIIQEENLDEFLSLAWKEKIDDLCKNLIHFEKNIKEFRISGENYYEFTINYKQSLEKLKACSEQVSLISIIMEKKQFLVDLEDYNDENYVNSFQKNLAKSIDRVKNFIKNIDDSKIMNYYYEINNSTEEFDVNSLEWKIIRICSTIDSELTILRKINESSTKSLTTNLIIAYLKAAENLTKDTTMRIEKNKLHFSELYKKLAIHKDNFIKSMHEKIALLENSNKNVRDQDLLKPLERKALNSNQEDIAQCYKQIQEVETYIAEQIIANKKCEAEAILDEEQQKEEKLQELKNKIFDDMNEEKAKIVNYYEKITEFIKNITISLYQFILYFKNNEWDREKYKLNNVINNVLKPGLIIKVEYKNDNLHYKLPYANFIYLTTENNNYVVLAVPNSEEANTQILSKEGRKILIKKLIAEEEYYFLSKKFCHLYTKFTIMKDVFLSEKNVNKILKKIELAANIKTIDNETPKMTNDRQTEIFQTELNKIFAEIDIKYDVLVTQLTEIFPDRRAEIINNGNIETKNNLQDLFKIINKYIETCIEDIIPKVTKIIEKESIKTEEDDQIEKITIVFQSELVKKDVETQDLLKTIVEKDEEIVQLKAQLTKVISKKETKTVSFSDTGQEYHCSEFLPSLANNVDNFVQSKISEDSTNIVSTLVS